MGRKNKKYGFSIISSCSPNETSLKVTDKSFSQSLENIKKALGNEVAPMYLCGGESEKTLHSDLCTLENQMDVGLSFSKIASAVMAATGKDTILDVLPNLLKVLNDLEAMKVECDKQSVYEATLEAK